GSIVAVGSLIGAIVAGVAGDRLARRSPADVVRVSAWAMTGMLFTVIAFQMPNVPLYCTFALLGQIPLFAVFIVLSVVIAQIVPPALRSLGFAFATVYIAVFGGL